MRRIRLTPVQVTAESFAPFGVVPPDEGDGGATADLEFLRNDGWVNYIAHALDEITVGPGVYRCELLNRHDTHTQTLMPMNAAAVIVVAPAGIDFSEPAHFDTVRAFTVPRHGCVHLLRGTWHWGPYPVGASELRIFNVQGRGYPDDNGIVQLARDHGLAYDVSVDPG